MNTKLLNTAIQSFIEEKSKERIEKMVFQKNPFPEVDWLEILNQIEAKQKSKTKLPTWYATKNCLYPKKISIEQSSSERTAAYKASLIEGESLIDITGGFGVDTYYFSKKIKKISHCEINENLSKMVAHNFKLLQVKNCTFFSGDSNEILEKVNKNWDWIYIDPSRRNESKGKVFLLKDCEPNISKYLDFYLQYSKSILIKTAPLLDLKAGLLDLKYVKNIHIIAIDNEVKELLWEIEANYDKEITIKTSNLANKTDFFEFKISSETINTSYSKPKKYVYEPNNAIMKSGGFDMVSVYFKIDKLHKNTHLYTSEHIVDFPGRVFEIIKIIDYNKKELKKEIQNTKANVSIRNFADTVENIRTKWKISDGGNLYYFFTTNATNDKIVLICQKMVVSHKVCK